MVFLKYYSQNFKNEDCFILNYKVINNRIIVNYANGNVDVFVYSIDREKEILSQMKEQVLGSKGCLKSLYNETMIYFKLLTNKLALFIFFVAIMLFFDVSLLAAAVTFTYFPVVIGLLVRKLIKCKGVIEDVKKNLLFLSNEEKINSDIRNKSEVRENIVEEVRDKVFSLDNGSFPFSFNSIDEISFDELKEIYDSAVEPKESNNAKVLSKKKIRNKR